MVEWFPERQRLSMRGWLHKVLRIILKRNFLPREDGIVGKYFILQQHYGWCIGAIFHARHWLQCLRKEFKYICDLKSEPKQQGLKIECGIVTEIHFEFRSGSPPAHIMEVIGTPPILDFQSCQSLSRMGVYPVREAFSLKDIF